MPIKSLIINMFAPTLIIISFCLVATVLGVLNPTTKSTKGIEGANKITTPENLKTQNDIGSKEVAYRFETWMSGLKDSLLLSDISIPGTHDSGAFKELNAFADELSQTQVMSIEQQLNSGIRALDIRCRPVRTDQTKEKRILGGFAFTIHHGRVFLHINLNDVLDSVTTFLEKNKSEFVVMRIQQEWADGWTGMPFSEILRKYTDHDDYAKYFWLNEGNVLDRTKLPPSLKHARGKIVILDATPTKGFGPIWESFPMQDNYEVKEVDLSTYEHASLVNLLLTQTYVDVLRKLVDYKFEVTTKFFKDPPPKEEGFTELVKINFTSACYDLRVGPRLFAKGGKWNAWFAKGEVVGMNARIEAYLKAEKIRPGWVFMDFPETSIIKTIIDFNFA